MTTPLPIDDALPALLEALRARGRAVLQAPPGAGKTTRVPLAVLEAGLVKGRILMLEPRRLATRAAAERMAQTLGEPVGATVGYRMRGEAKVANTTRIEVVTEGILTRMIQSDAELTGIGAVIFDEFHERSLNADLGLALALEVAGALREDLMLIAMSATLDAGPVAALMGDVPVVTSEGRAFPVQTRWLDRPVPKTQRYEQAVAGLVADAVGQTTGGVLVFLPGEGEIRRVEGLLKGRLPGDCVLRPLFGAMPFKDQRAAIAPVTAGRKVVLATSIAETSLTIEDIRVVVDGGRARRTRFDPGSGMSRLVTERVTRAEAEQRRGRAGRVAEGTCFRLWTKGEEGALPAYPPSEIEAADLTGLALELAEWGAGDGDLAFLTPPPEGTLAEARALLRGLGALDAGGQITAHGKALARLPLHPRLGHMLLAGGERAADMAALLAERDPLPRGGAVDLTLRLRALREPGAMGANRGVIERVRAEAKRLARHAGDGKHSVAELAALAYPDRVGLRRKGTAPRFVLSGGKGAVLDEGDPLAGARLIVALDLDGDTREARVRLAVGISEGELRAVHGNAVHWRELCHWSKRDRRVEARRQEVFGALVLEDRLWKDAPADAMANAALDGVRDLGLQALNMSDAVARYRARVELLRRGGAEMPDMSDDGLMAALGDWLLPHLDGVKTVGDLKGVNVMEALKLWLGWEREQVLDRLAPAKFITPMGRGAAIDYSGVAPAVEIRLQEMFGVTIHPCVGPDRQPLRITLLSPAQRPIQTTMDLPGFWSGSYADVRKDMRARYPKHPWPEDPAAEKPTLKAKRRPK
ncbi:MAG: ATP-dependent helicase HrpB [Brevirhabdus sp.]